MAYARRRTEPASVDDVVAETLLVAWRRLDAVPADAPLPWLYGVARRVLANQRRARDRRHRLALRLAAGSQPAIGEPDGVSGELGVDVLAALATLGAADREVLRLAAWEQLTAAEIAIVLGCSANAAALRLSRARRKLRLALTETGGSRTRTAWRNGNG